MRTQSRLGRWPSVFAPTPTSSQPKIIHFSHHNHENHDKKCGGGGGLQTETQRSETWNIALLIVQE